MIPICDYGQPLTPLIAGSFTLAAPGLRHQTLEGSRIAGFCDRCGPSTTQSRRQYVGRWSESAGETSRTTERR